MAKLVWISRACSTDLACTSLSKVDMSSSSERLEYSLISVTIACQPLQGCPVLEDGAPMGRNHRQQACSRALPRPGPDARSGARHHHVSPQRSPWRLRLRKW